MSMVPILGILCACVMPLMVSAQSTGYEYSFEKGQSRYYRITHEILGDSSNDLVTLNFVIQVKCEGITNQVIGGRHQRVALLLIKHSSFMSETSLDMPPSIMKAADCVDDFEYTARVTTRGRFVTTTLSDSLAELKARFSRKDGSLATEEERRVGLNAVRYLTDWNRFFWDYAMPQFTVAQTECHIESRKWGQIEGGAFRSSRRDLHRIAMLRLKRDPYILGRENAEMQLLWSDLTEKISSEQYVRPEERKASGDRIACLRTARLFDSSIGLWVWGYEERESRDESLSEQVMGVSHGKARLTFIISEPGVARSLSHSDHGGSPHIVDLGAYLGNRHLDDDDAKRL